MPKLRHILAGVTVNLCFWAAAQNLCAQAFTDMPPSQKHDFLQKTARNNESKYSHLPNFAAFMHAYYDAADPTISAKPDWQSLGARVKQDSGRPGLGDALDEGLSFILGTKAPEYTDAAQALVQNARPFFKRPDDLPLDFYDRPKKGTTEEQLGLAREFKEFNFSHFTEENNKKMPDYLAGPVYGAIATAAELGCNTGKRYIYTAVADEIFAEHKSAVKKYMRRHGLKRPINITGPCAGSAGKNAAKL